MITSLTGVELGKWGTCLVRKENFSSATDKITPRNTVNTRWRKKLRWKNLDNGRDGMPIRYPRKGIGGEFCCFSQAPRRRLMRWNGEKQKKRGPDPEVVAITFMAGVTMARHDVSAPRNASTRPSTFCSGRRTGVSKVHHGRNLGKATPFCSRATIKAQRKKERKKERRKETTTATRRFPAPFFRTLRPFPRPLRRVKTGRVIRRVAELPIFPQGRERKRGTAPSSASSNLEPVGCPPHWSPIKCWFVGLLSRELQAGCGYLSLDVSDGHVDSCGCAEVAISRPISGKERTLLPALARDEKTLVANVSRTAGFFL